VQDYNGAIVVESTLGVGTEFALYFPPAEGPAPVLRSDSLPTVPVGQGERVLVVDDDAVVCNVAASLLQRIGYKPFPFLEPAEALAAFERAPQDFDLVLTDLTMPGMTGVELAGRILAARPRMPVIIGTGYLRTEAIEHARAVGVNHFAKKPYALEDLAVLLNTALHRTGSDTGHGI